MARTRFFALGGQDENGKNCFILEADNKIFVINSGVKVPINVSYGVDTITPNIDYLIKNEKRIAGIFITDTKNDSFSALPWFLMQLKKVKVYTSPFNKVTILDRISKYKITSKEHEIISFGQKTTFGKVSVKPIQLFGSIPGTYGFTFETPEGSFVFMLNFVYGKSNLFGSTNLQGILNTITKKPFTLFLDAGKSNLVGYANQKMSTPNRVKEIFKNASPNERIIVSAYDEEMFSLVEMVIMAHLAKRPIVVYGKTFLNQWKLLNNEFFQKRLPVLKEIQFANYKKMAKLNNVVVFVTGTVEHLYQRLIRIANNEDVFLKFKKNDNAVVLAPPVNGLETLAANTYDQIAKITRKLLVVNSDEHYQHRPAKEDLLEVVKTLKPDFVVPLQGLYRYLMQLALHIQPLGYSNENTLVLQNGAVATFENGKAKRGAKVRNIGDKIVDGFGLGDVSFEVINEREKLARDGVVFVSCLIDKEEQLFGEIDIKYVGLASKRDRKLLDEQIKSVLIHNYYDQHGMLLYDLQKLISKRIRKKVSKIIFKEPSVIVNFYKI